MDGLYNIDLRAGAPYGDKTYREVIPEHILLGINRYAKYGLPPGRFMMAVLTGDLFKAVSMADEQCLVALPAIVRYISNRIPGPAIGSHEKIDAWLDRGGHFQHKPGDPLPEGWNG